MRTWVSNKLGAIFEAELKSDLQTADVAAVEMKSVPLQRLLPIFSGLKQRVFFAEEDDRGLIWVCV